MNSLRVPLATVTLCAAFAAHAAPILIDDFSTPSDFPITLTQSGEQGATVNDVSNPNFFVAGTIGAVLTQSTDASHRQRLLLAIDNGTLDYSSDARVDGTFRSRYDFGNADFGDNRAFRLEFAFVEHDLPFSVRLFGSNLVTGEEDTVSGVIPAGSTTFDVSGFNVSDVVFHHIFLAEFRFDPPKAGDISLDSIQIVPGPQSVPEPTSLAALGLGAVALLRRRKRA